MDTLHMHLVLAAVPAVLASRICMSVSVLLIQIAKDLCARYSQLDEAGKEEVLRSLAR